MKMTIEDETVVVCSRNKLMCEIDLKRMMKTIFQGCVLNKSDKGPLPQQYVASAGSWLPSASRATCATS